MAPGNLLRPPFHPGILHLHGPAASATDQVVMMAGGLAPSIHGGGIAGTNHVYLAGSHQRLKGPIHGGKTHLVPASRQQSMDSRHGEKAARLAQGPSNRSTLTRRPRLPREAFDSRMFLPHVPTLVLLKMIVNNAFIWLARQLTFAPPNEIH